MARMKSWHDRIQAYMVAHGYAVVPMRSAKYTRYAMTVNGEKYRQYVLGRNGNVRREFIDAITGSVLGSASVTELFKKYVEKWEQQQLQKDA